MGDETRDIFKEEKKSLFPTPRPFQDKAHEMLREGYRAGHRKQLICSGTGSGKTVLALRIIKEATDRGRSAMFICDRTTLINQTSDVASRFGMEHGIIQADHWRKNNELFQIASAQTLARRKWTPRDVTVVDECFVDDVEVLTGRGFVRFDSVGYDDLIAQYHEGGEIDFAYPARIVERHYDGDVVRFHGERGFDIAVTPSHDMVVEHPVRGVEKVRAEKLKPNHLKKFVCAGRASSESCDHLSAIERMCIAFQADGSTHDLPSNGTMVASFTFVKQRKIDRFLELLRDGAWRFTEVNTSRGGRRRFLVYGLPVISKVVSRHFDLTSISAKKGEAIIAEMVEWDGSKISDVLWYYSSVIKDNADFYQSVCLLSGIRSTITIQVDERSDSYNDVHRLFIRRKDDRVVGSSIKKEVVKYSGSVYCVTVPSGMIIVRRNGRAVVCGNCHTQLKAWTDLIRNDKSGLAVIGLSATPFSKGLGNLFTNVINAASMHELTRDGYLVPMRVFTCTKPDMAGAATLGGEWTSEAAAKRELEIVGDVVIEWFKFAENRKTIVLGSTIEHCNELCRQFNEAGVLAAVYTSKTDEATRLDLLEEFKDHDTPLRILVSVEALAKGFDQPDVNCVCDARPLRKSLSSAIQMWGRGLRISPETGKKDCLLLDFSGNYLRFLEDFEYFYYNGIASLNDGEKLDKEVRKDEQSEERACPNCGHRPFVKRCVACGHESKSLSLIQHQPGEMVEITIGRDKKKAADSPEHLWAQLATYVRQSGKAETQRQRAFYLYRDIMGRSPPEHFAIGNAPVVDITPAVISKIRSRQIAYSKGMQKGARRA